MNNQTKEVPEGFVLLKRENGKPIYAACMDGGRFHGWLMWKHPDGQWVSKRKLESWEVMQVEDQEHYGIVNETTAPIAAPGAGAVPDGWKLVPVEANHAICKAMAESQAVDDEGKFPVLTDLIDFSGENKTHTVLCEAYRCAVAAAPSAPIAAQKPVDPTITEENVVKVLNDALWKFIDVAAAFPECKPDDEIWAHVLAYKPKNVPLPDFTLKGTHWEKSVDDLAIIDKALRGKVNDPDPIKSCAFCYLTDQNSYTTTYGLVAGLLRERDCLASQLAANPVAEYDGVEFSRYTIRWTDGPMPIGTKLYTAPPAGQDAKQADLVPGKLRCAKCNFSLIRTTLNVATGNAYAGDNKTEPCPNGCGPLWPMTWEQEAREGYKLLDQLLERATKAENALATQPPQGVAVDAVPDWYRWKVPGTECGHITKEPNASLTKTYGEPELLYLHPAPADCRKYCQLEADQTAGLTQELKNQLRYVMNGAVEMGWVSDEEARTILASRAIGIAAPVPAPDALAISEEVVERRIDAMVAQRLAIALAEARAEAKAAPDARDGVLHPYMIDARLIAKHYASASLHKDGSPWQAEVRIYFSDNDHAEFAFEVLSVALSAGVRATLKSQATQPSAEYSPPILRLNPDSTVDIVGHCKLQPSAAPADCTYPNCACIGGTTSICAAPTSTLGQQVAKARADEKGE